jgi:Xaa-Pro aminopeptidase
VVGVNVLVKSNLVGFTGSAGTAIVTPSEAAMFTDGRYFLQAGKQLDSNWTLMKQGLPKVPTWKEWAIEQAKNCGRNVGVDANLITQPDAQV